VSGYDTYLDRILDAPPSRNSMYFERGTFLVRIDDLLFSTNRKNEVNSIWESTIVRSNNVDLPPGTSTGWIQKMSRDSSAGNIKMNLCGVLGLQKGDLEDDAGKNAVRRAYSDEKDGKSPLAGRLCKVIVIRRISGEGRSYLFTTFQVYPIQDDEALPSNDQWIAEHGVATTAVREDTLERPAGEMPPSDASIPF
jgi:hypothetical protein